MLGFVPDVHSHANVFDPGQRHYSLMQLQPESLAVYQVCLFSGLPVPFANARSDAQQAARKLALLKRSRRMADYGICSELRGAEVASCVRESRKIARLIRSARFRYSVEQGVRQA